MLSFESLTSNCPHLWDCSNVSERLLYCNVLYQLVLLCLIEDILHSVLETNLLLPGNTYHQSFHTDPVLSIQLSMITQSDVEYLLKRLIKSIAINLWKLILTNLNIDKFTLKFQSIRKILFSCYLITKIGNC